MSLGLRQAQLLLNLLMHVQLNLLNEAILTSYQSDEADWDRWAAAKRGTTKLDKRSATGVAQQKKYQEKYREEHKKQLRTDAVLRDGPRYDTKQCQTCSEFMPKQSAVCPSCNIPATKKGTFV